jgi:hypothetical protein
VQDDKSDWELESGNMAAIYRNAFVVVGADMSKDCNSGFLDAWKPSEYPLGPALLLRILRIEILAYIILKLRENA